MLYPIELLGRGEMRASMVAIIHAFVMRDRESEPAYGAPAMDEWNVIAKYPTQNCHPCKAHGRHLENPS